MQKGVEGKRWRDVGRNGRKGETKRGERDMEIDRREDNER